MSIILNWLRRTNNLMIFVKQQAESFHTPIKYSEGRRQQEKGQLGKLCLSVCCGQRKPKC